MSAQHEALKLALEALNKPRPSDGYPPLWRAYEKTIDDAITACEQALQGLCRTDGRCQYAIDSGAEGAGHCPPGKCCMPAQPAPDKEPLSELEKDAANLLFALHDAWPYVHGHCTIESKKKAIQALIVKHGDFADLQPTTPQPAPWVELTLDEKHYLNEALNLQGRFPVIEAIEAKLREKNGGAA